jgi:hypothetical protein
MGLRMKILVEVESEDYEENNMDESALTSDVQTYLEDAGITVKKIYPYKKEEGK